VRVVAVMTRSPGAPAEAIKTRLAPALPDPAQRRALHLACLQDTVAAARRVTGARVRVAATPEGPAEAFRDIGIEPGHVFPQQGEDLGAREREVFARLFRQGARQVVLIGSDIPTLSTATLEAAFAALDEQPGRVVIGPAADGGYYLLGLTGPQVPDLFSGVRWGTCYALADTLRRCEFENRRFDLLPVLEDVDTPAALRRLRDLLAEEPAHAPATAALLASTLLA
jgi:uncharacterized protein